MPRRKSGLNILVWKCFGGRVQRERGSGAHFDYGLDVRGRVVFRAVGAGAEGSRAVGSGG